MLWFFWVLIALFIIYILDLVLVLILENRDPYKTIAWVLVLIFLPIIGLIIYLLVGESIKKKYYSWKFGKKRYQKIVQEIVDAQKESIKHDTLSKDIKDKRHTMYLALHSTNFPFSTNNKVKILNNGDEFYPELFKDLENAKDTIHMEYYIFRNDALGKKVMDLLIKKASEGVKVRILIDGMGSATFPQKVMNSLKEKNVIIEEFIPVFYSIFRSKINHRNHRKICVIDGQIGYIGGINIGQEYLDGGKFNFWRDMQLRISGSAVYSLQSIFIRDWGFATKNDIYDPLLYPKINIVGDSSLHISPSGPDNRWANLKLIIFSTITTSENKLWIETPYFVPDDALLMALKSTALKGVDVRLILPDKNDAVFPSYASKTFYMELLDAGVKIYEYQKGFIHTKLLISDNLSSIGSTNLDSRSLNLDFEASAFIFDYKVTDELSKVFLKDLLDCRAVTKKDLYSTSKFTRFKQSLARLLTPII